MYDPLWPAIEFIIHQSDFIRYYSSVDGIQSFAVNYHKNNGNGRSMPIWWALVIMKMSCSLTYFRYMSCISLFDRNFVIKLIINSPFYFLSQMLLGLNKPWQDYERANKETRSINIVCISAKKKRKEQKIEEKNCSKTWLVFYHRFISNAKWSNDLK